ADDGDLLALEDGQVCVIVVEALCCHGISPSRKVGYGCPHPSVVRAPAARNAVSDPLLAAGARGPGDGGPPPLARVVPVPVRGDPHLGVGVGVPGFSGPRGRSSTSVRDRSRASRTGRSP